MVVKKRDVLQYGLISDIRAYSDTQTTVRINYREWSPSVVGLSGPITLITLSDELTERVVNCLTEVFSEFDFVGLRAYATHTFGGRLSFIPWHNDCNYMLSVTVYLNEVWDRDWGGYFVYENDDGNLGAFAPEFNTAVGFKCPLQHCTVMPALNAPVRESIQIFFGQTHET